MITWDLYLGDIHLTSKSGSKVEYIEVTNSDDSYFQYGSVSTTEDLSTINIGSNARVLIDDTEVFRGYVSKIGRTGMGAKFFSVNLVGETYDLWRYSTPEELEYDNLYTTYIASSLVASYVSGITMNAESLHASGAFIPTIDLSNLKVGDAIAKLTKYDGYKFYVNSGVLYYYQPSEGTLINITESDILDMSPIEESDEDIVNVCKVIGGTGYSSKTKVDDSRKSPIYFFAGDYVAQQFTATDEQLSAIQLYLDRTKDPNQPGNLDFEIWENTEMILFQDEFTTNKYLDGGYNITRGSFPTWDYYTEFETDRLMLNVSKTYSLATSHESCGESTINQAGNAVAMTFKPKASGVVYRARLSTLWLCGLSYIRYYICTTGATGEPDLSNVLCSSNKTKDIVGGGNYTPLWGYFPNGVELTSGTTYALVASGPDLSNPPGDNAIYPHYLSDYDEYTDGCYWNRKGTSWTQWSTRDLGVSVDLRYYYRSGVISSNSYSYDTRYMKLDLAGVHSGSWIKISGTNDGGTTWKELTNGSWIDFGSESSAGTYIKYKFSSNGYFTPRIDSATLTVSDDSGGFETFVYSDDFNDYTYLSSNSAKGDITIEDNKLTLANITPTLVPYTPDSAENVYYSPSLYSWNNYSNMIDGNYDTYAERDGENKAMMNSIDIFTFDPPINLRKIRWSAGAVHVVPTEFLYLNDIWVSTQTSNGWIHAKGYGENYFGKKMGITGTSPYNPKTVEEDLGAYYYSTTKVKIAITSPDNGGLAGGALRIHEVEGVGFLNYFKSGLIKTSSLSLNVSEDQSFIRNVINYSYNTFTLSGSLDGGTNWTRLPVNDTTSLNSGKDLILCYYLYATKPTEIPELDSIQIYTSVQGGGIPKSGSKVEWSDDISWNAGDVPYPPSWSSWKSYSSPKLQLSKGNRYWMIFKLPESTGDSDYDFGPETSVSKFTGTSGNVSNESAFGGAIEMEPGGSIWEDVDMSSKTNGYVNFIVPGQYDGSDRKVKVTVRDNSTKDTTILGYADPEGTYKEFTYEIPSSYLNANMRVIFEPGESGKCGYIRDVSIYHLSDAWKFYYNQDSDIGKVALSYDHGYKWSTNATDPDRVPPGDLLFRIGWKQGSTTYTAIDTDSLSTYGRYYKEIRDDSITTYSAARLRAEAEIDAYKNKTRKGHFTIDGNLDVSLTSRIQSNLDYLGISGQHDVVSYTHRIDGRGFTTTINYGVQPYDIAKKVASLEREVFGG